MRKKITFRLVGVAAFGLLILASCKHRPSGVISESKMVDVMVDMQLAEAYASSQITGSEREQRRLELADAVLASHGVTQEEVDSTLQWYGRNLDDYTKLYEKVDKRLLAKKKDLTKGDAQLAEAIAGDNLWPFGKNGVISPLGNSDGWVFSLPEPELQKGDRIVWKFHVGESSNALNGVLGVEYEDGTSEASTSFFSNRKTIELSLQTDTGKVVKRLYGTMRLKEMTDNAMFADSISLEKMPFDSLEYYRGRSQKRYGIPVRRDLEKERQRHIADSLRRDSISKARRESFNEHAKTVKNGTK